jgi:uncharacterized phage protein gp47/JayE
MGIYLTDDGFVGKTQNEIIAELEDGYKDIHGDDIDLDADSAFGQEIGLFSKFLVQPWDALGELYTCFDPNHATGVCLDNVVALNAIQRLSATATFVSNVLLEGDEGTIVAANKKIKKTTSPILYSLVNQVTITKTTAAKGVIEVTTVAAGTYRVVINSTNYDYVAGGGETKTQILNAVEALITAGSWTGTATVASEQLTLYDISANFSFDITGNLSIEETWIKGDFQCDDTGANTAPADSLIEISTPVTGWNSVINPSAGLTGRELETDSELRTRRAQSIIKGNATDEAIRSNIFNNVSGVTAVQVFSNRTDLTDGEGRPPHSFEAVVEGGTDDDVADEIWARQPSGIASYGNVNGGAGITIQDSQGQDQIVEFSRPETVYIYVRVKRSLYSEETYPSNGDDLIKSNIVNWSLLEENITVGKDVITSRLISPVYGFSNNSDIPVIPGIENVEVELDSSTSLPHSPSYSGSNISITDRQKASFAIARIDVTTLP